MHRLLLTIVLLGAAAAPALAEPGTATLFPARAGMWQRVTFAPGITSSPGGQTSPAPKLAAVEYSDAYRTRAKIHKYASVAMLPLVGTELFLGNSLYNNPSDSKKAAHIAVGTGIMGLFAVNTVTGAWNLWDARKDPNGRTRRMLHGILMMAADAGFLATAATGPSREREFEDAFFGGNSRNTHRAIAVTSIATATAGYLIMLVGGR